MPRVCSVCNKGPMFGNNVSHANNKTKKVSRPNLQRVLVVLPSGERRRKLVCAQCIASNAITKG